MPYVAKVSVGKLDMVHIFGNDYPTLDGTCQRDYIQVVDLAKSYIAALNKVHNNLLQPGRRSLAQAHAV